MDEARQMRGDAAIADTIRFLKSVKVPHFEAHVVQYESAVRTQGRAACVVMSDRAGRWNVVSSYTWAPDDALYMSFRQQQRSIGQAWAHITVWDNPFWGAGEIVSNGFEVVRVRIQSEDGYSMEDTPLDEIVLWLTDSPHPFPAAIECYDAAGNVVGRQNGPTLGMQTFRSR
jgi:hypothetical protein